MLKNENSVSFDQPLQLMHVCHGKIMQQCSALRSLTVHTQQHGCDQNARQSAQSILNYFETSGELHHLDEELELFPALRAAFTTETVEHMEALMAKVLQQHAELAVLWADLQPHLQQLADGKAVPLASALTEKFIEGYFSHIALGIR